MVMKYKVNINGIDVEATYSADAIKNVIEPLLLLLAEIRQQKGGRVLAMIAAPPGAGKSTLVSFLEYYSKALLPELKVQAIGMDGFHGTQEYLTSHDTEVDGKMIPMVQIKGAPVTFDLEAFVAKIKEVLGGGTALWPTYDRHLHNPIEDAITVTGDIVILEGNYLLLDEEGWRDIHKMADYTIFLRGDEEVLRKRLVDRKEASGNSRDKAEAFVDFSDMRNVRLCLDHSLPADLELRLEDFV
jgi:pantothenate kinase